MKTLKNLLPGAVIFFASVTPMLAMSDDEAAGAAVAAAMGGAMLILVIGIVITIFFLVAESAFVDTIKTSNPLLNTSKVWIWTQLIPLWNIVATPVTLLKIEKQFAAFVQEHHLTESDIKYYNSVWGWLWFGGNVASIFLPVFGIVGLIGLIGFWVHINSVKKSIIMRQINNTPEARQPPARTAQNAQAPRQNNQDMDT